MTPDHLIEDTKAAIKEAMEGIKLLPIPLVADMAVVQKWGDAK
jgi:DNA polymerase I-like protein with 3'-5' exonuclease and polymerase domains